MNISQAINQRWSPRAFSDQSISEEVLEELFKAAGTAPSCFNEQPWSFIVGVKGTETYDLVLSTMVEWNQSWAKTAPVVMIAFASNKFHRNGNDNPHAWHDLGQATAFLTLKAMDHGIFLHQMAGFDAQKAKGLLNIPKDHEAVTAIAMGYLGDKSSLPEDIAAQESPESPRKNLDEILFRAPLS